MKKRWPDTDRRRGLLERKAGAEPRSLSQKLGSSEEVLFEPTCMPVGAHALLCVPV